MIEKLFLHLIYECHRADVALPWQEIMKRFAPNSTPESAMQQLNRVRETLISEGHMVPPLLGRRSVAQKPDVRGIIRDMAQENPKATREVDWQEDIIDRSESLVVSGVVRGSGRYPRRPRNSGEVNNERQAREQPHSTQIAAGRPIFPRKLCAPAPIQIRELKQLKDINVNASEEMLAAAYTQPAIGNSTRSSSYREISTRERSMGNSPRIKSEPSAGEDDKMATVNPRKRARRSGLRRKRYERTDERNPEEVPARSDGMASDDEYKPAGDLCHESLYRKGIRKRGNKWSSRGRLSTGEEVQMNDNQNIFDPTEERRSMVIKLRMDPTFLVKLSRHTHKWSDTQQSSTKSHAIESVIRIDPHPMGESPRKINAHISRSRSQSPDTKHVKDLPQDDQYFGPTQVSDLVAEPDRSSMCSNESAAKTRATSSFNDASPSGWVASPLEDALKLPTGSKLSSLSAGTFCPQTSLSFFNWNNNDGNRNQDPIHRHHSNIASFPDIYRDEMSLSSLQVIDSPVRASMSVAAMLSQQIQHTAEGNEDHLLTWSPSHDDIESLADDLF